MSAKEETPSPSGGSGRTVMKLAAAVAALGAALGMRPSDAGAQVKPDTLKSGRAVPTIAPQAAVLTKAAAGGAGVATGKSGTSGGAGSVDAKGAATSAGTATGKTGTSGGAGSADAKGTATSAGTATGKSGTSGGAGSVDAKGTAASAGTATGKTAQGGAVNSKDSTATQPVVKPAPRLSPKAPIKPPSQ